MTMTSEVNWVYIRTEDLRALFDLAVNSMDFGSGFWDSEDVAVARKIAQSLGIDPMIGVPFGFRSNYRHKFKPNPPSFNMDRCWWCSQTEDHVAHDPEESK